MIKVELWKIFFAKMVRGGGKGESERMKDDNDSERKVCQWDMWDLTPQKTMLLKGGRKLATKRMRNEISNKIKDEKFSSWSFSIPILFLTSHPHRSHRVASPMFVEIQ
jgi:hypothetical protein